MASITMDKTKRMKLIALASGVILVILLAYLFLFNGNGESNNNQQPSVNEVVVLKTQVPAYTQINETDVALQKVTDANLSVYSNAATKIDDVVGSYTLVDMGPNEVVLNNHISKFTDDGIASGLSVKLSDGTRAMTLSVDDVSGIAGLLKVGNHVDVIVSHSLDESKTTSSGYSSSINNDTAAGYLAQDVPVLALGKTLSSDSRASGSSTTSSSASSSTSSSSSSSTSSSSSSVSSYTTVTLQLTPEQTLALAAAEGGDSKIYLALRSSDENGQTVNIPPARVSEIIGLSL